MKRTNKAFPVVFLSWIKVNLSFGEFSLNQGRDCVKDSSGLAFIRFLLITELLRGSEFFERRRSLWFA